MEDNGLRVSIVTVVRNGEAHLEKCITSVLGQTYPNFEYIIIDGGSTDGTLAIIERYRHRLAAFVSEPDNGISDAFNKGLKLATGHITGLVNADDWLEPGAIALVAKEAAGCDVLYANMRQWNSNQAQYILTGDHRKLETRMSLNHPAVFIRKAVYEQVGYYNTRYRLAMDYELLLRCYKAGLTFGYCNAVITNMKTEGASDRNWLAALKEVRRAKDEQLGPKPIHYMSYLIACCKTSLSRWLLHSPLEPLFSAYRKQSKNTQRQESGS